MHLLPGRPSSSPLRRFRTWFSRIVPYGFLARLLLPHQCHSLCSICGFSCSIEFEHLLIHRRLSYNPSRFFGGRTRGYASGASWRPRRGRHLGREVEKEFYACKPNKSCSSTFWERKTPSSSSRCTSACTPGACSSAKGCGRTSIARAVRATHTSSARCSMRLTVSRRRRSINSM